MVTRRRNLRRRVNSRWNWDWRNSTNYGVSEDNTIDGQPYNLVLTIVDDTQIDLSWTIGSTNHDGHSIERSTDNITYTEIATVTGNTSTYSDTGLTTNTTYYYRVKAYRNE